MIDRVFQYLCRSCCFRHPKMGWIYKATKYIDCNGRRKKVEVIYTSLISHEDAKTKANALVDERIATLIATVCAPPPVTYTSTQEATAYCDVPECGDPVTESATATSTISQSDADNKAYAAALSLATSELICKPRFDPPTLDAIHTDDTGDWSISYNPATESPNGVHYIPVFPESGYVEGDTTDTEFTGHLNGGNQPFSLTLITNGDETHCQSEPLIIEGTLVGESGVMMWSSVQTVTVQCPFGTIGAEQTATRAAQSTASQEDADNIATAAATAAATALLDCTSVPVYTSTKTAEVSCTPPEIGDNSVATETRSSIVSQEDADALALAAATASATAGLHCVLPEFTSIKCVTKDCPGGSTGTSVTACETRTSTVSQADADTLASAAADAAASAMLICTWEGTASYTADCPEGTFGESVTRTGHAYSNVSQEDADTQALAVATAAANAALDCHTVPVYCSTQSYTAECPDGYHGDPVTRYAHYCSEVDLTDAEVHALAEAQALAEADLSCEPD